MACQRTMLTSCLSKQAHYKGCYKAHTSDQAGSATGTVFPTFSLTSSTEGPWQNGPQPPSLNREDSRHGRGWRGASEAAFWQATPPMIYITPSAGPGGREAQQIWGQN